MKLLTRRYFLSLAGLYSLFIVYGTSVPFVLKTKDWGSFWSRFFNLWHDTHFWMGVEDTIENFILFFILGLLLKVAFLPHSKYHGLKVIGACLYGFFLTYCIESFQAVCSARCSSLFDVWVDGLSCAFGVLFMWILQVSCAHRFLLHLFIKTLKRNLFGFAAFLAGFFIFFGALFPFNAVPKLWNARRQNLFTEFQTFLSMDWSDSQLWMKSLNTFLIYFLFAFFLYLFFIAKYKKTSRRFFWLTIQGSLALVVILELLQIYFPPSYFEFSQIGAAWLGAVFGALTGILMKPFVVVAHDAVGGGKKQMDTIFLISLAIVTFLALLDWLRPFHLVRDYKTILQTIYRVQFNPFQAYSQSFFWSMEGFFRKFSILFAWSSFLTFWLTERFQVKRMKPSYIGYITALAALILEVIQIPILGRGFSLLEMPWGFLAGYLGGGTANVILRWHRSRDWRYIPDFSGQSAASEIKVSDLKC